VTTNSIPDALQAAITHHQAGRLLEAEALYRQILEVQPGHPDALNNLGNVLQEQGKFEEALAQYRQAVALRPDSAETHNNMAGALYAQGKLEEAATCYQQALAIRADYVAACLWLGKVRQEQGRHAEATGCYQRALALGAANADVFNHLGVVLEAQGRREEAFAAYQQALTLKPDFAEVYNNLGNVLRAEGRLEEAGQCYRQALTLKPDFAVAYYNIGQVLGAQGRNGEAAQCYQQAISLKPDFAEAHNNLGNALREQGKLEEAVAHYRQAIEHNPSLAQAYRNLGALFRDQGRVEEAAVEFQHALRLKPDDGLKILIATMLPVIYESKEHLTQARRQYERQVSRLLEEDLVLSDPSVEVGATNFYLAYHGQNDRELQVKVAKLYERACPSLLYRAPHCASWQGVPKGGKIKIGFISRHFKDHSIAKAARGVLARLSREKFDVTAVFVPPVSHDEAAAFIRQHADRAVVLPENLEAARLRIAEETLDILFYQDIGMDPITYFLAFSRLAPVQCVSFGHPVTSGIRNIDYFLSTEDFEPGKGEAHYSERLIKLKSLIAYAYEPPRPAPMKPRKAFGFGKQEHIYVCPQTLFKFHPDFDEILAGILRADPQGRLILKAGNVPQWMELLLRRLRRTMGKLAERITVVPRQADGDFTGLLAASDVMLDTLYFSGYTTSLEAFAVGMPIVTLPGEFQRGRHTLGLYRQMGIQGCIADSPARYVKIAVRLGTDADYREAVKAKILANKSRLFEDQQVVMEYERVFLQMVNERARGS
jgi:predicted O-linked N-acetylglucosamine transferase (SPINDLY family)